MHITYTNRKGRTCYLCQGITKTGKPLVLNDGAERRTTAQTLGRHVASLPNRGDLNELVLDLLDQFTRPEGEPDTF